MNVFVKLINIHKTPTLPIVEPWLSYSLAMYKNVVTDHVLYMHAIRMIATAQ